MGRLKIKALKTLEQSFVFYLALVAKALTGKSQAMHLVKTAVLELEEEFQIDHLKSHIVNSEFNYLSILL